MDKEKFDEAKSIIEMLLALKKDRERMEKIDRVIFETNRGVCFFLDLYQVNDDYGTGDLIGIIREIVLVKMDSRIAELEKKFAEI